jgi:hypothetical protein
VRVRASDNTGGVLGEQLVQLAPDGQDTVIDLTLPVVPVRISVRTAGGDVPGDDLIYNVVLRRPGASLAGVTALGGGEFAGTLPVNSGDFTARAEFYATGLIARADGTLGAGDTRAALTIVLPMLGTLSGQVLDAAGAPVAGARIGIAPAGGSSQPDIAFTGEDGRFSLMSVPYGRYELNVALQQGGGARQSGELGAPVQEVTLVLPATGTVEALASGDQPFGSATLFSPVPLGPGGESDPLQLGASLTGNLYRFENVPPGPFAVLESPGRGTAGGQAVPATTVQAALRPDEAPGVVYGRATASDGVTPLGQVGVATNVPAPIGMSRTVTQTSPGGYYLTRGVQPGTVHVGANLFQDGTGGAGSSGVLAPGGTLRLDLRNRASTIATLPTTLAGRQIGQGLVLALSQDALDQALAVNGMEHPGTDYARMVTGAPGLEIGPAPFAGAEVTRHVYVPTGAGWVRYLEILRNPGDVPLALTVSVGGRSAGSAALTSSGGLPASLADRWAAAAGDASRPALAFVFGGAGAAEGPSEVAFLSGERTFTPYRAYRYGWRLTLGPGDSAAYLHYAVIGTSPEPAGAAQLAEALSSGQAPGALDGIAPEVAALIRNFALTIPVP